jgi:hypothetical protein
MINAGTSCTAGCVSGYVGMIASYICAAGVQINGPTCVVCTLCNMSLSAPSASTLLPMTAAFSTLVTSYAASVSWGISTLLFTATLSSGLLLIAGVPCTTSVCPAALSVGANNILVTSGDGGSYTYFITRSSPSVIGMNLTCLNSHTGLVSTVAMPFLLGVTVYNISVNFVIISCNVLVSTIQIDTVSTGVVSGVVFRHLSMQVCQCRTL